MLCSILIRTPRETINLPLPDVGMVGEAFQRLLDFPDISGVLICMLQQPITPANAWKRRKIHSMQEEEKKRGQDWSIIVTSTLGTCSDLPNKTLDFFPTRWF